MSKRVTMLYCFILLFSVISMIFSANVKNVKDPDKMPEKLKLVAPFRFHFFTIWNYALQIIFLILAVTDEISKIANFRTIQRLIEKIRLFIFSTLVFPSTLLVITIFWIIWHIDRELIFPRVLDEFYPSWLNHTLHTFVIVPLIVEVLVQWKNKNYRISRSYSAIILMTYCALYQYLYLSIYFKHGIWLYPVYKVLTWTQRIAFIGVQLFLVLSYQQIGISLLKTEKVQKTKTL